MYEISNERNKIVSELLVCSIRVTGLWYQSYWFVVSELLVYGIRVTGL
jgi:hypothetical protein